MGRRREIGRVRFKEDAVARSAGEYLPQRAGASIGHGAAHADEVPAAPRLGGHGLAAAEAMEDHRGQPGSVLGEDAHGLRVCLSIVDGDGKAQSIREAQLGTKRRFLRVPRRKVSKEIQADLSDADHFRARGQRFQFGERDGRQVRGVVWVDGPLGDAMLPIVAPDAGPSVMSALEYIDTVKEGRTGVTRYSAGLDDPYELPGELNHLG